MINFSHIAARKTAASVPYTEDSLQKFVIKYPKAFVKKIQATQEAYDKVMNRIKPIAGDTFGELKADPEDMLEDEESFDDTPATEGEKALEQLTPEAAEVAAQTLAAIEKEAEAIADAPAQMDC